MSSGEQTSKLWWRFFHFESRSCAGVALYILVALSMSCPYFSCKHNDSRAANTIVIFGSRSQKVVHTKVVVVNARVGNLKGS